MSHKKNPPQATGAPKLWTIPLISWGGFLFKQRFVWLGVRVWHQMSKRRNGKMSDAFTQFKNPYYLPSKSRLYFLSLSRSSCFHRTPSLLDPLIIPAEERGWIWYLSAEGPQPESCVPFSLNLEKPDPLKTDTGSANADPVQKVYTYGI